MVCMPGVRVYPHLDYVGLRGCYQFMTLSTAIVLEFLVFKCFSYRNVYISPTKGQFSYVGVYIYVCGLCYSSCLLCLCIAEVPSVS